MKKLTKILFQIAVVSSLFALAGCSDETNPLSPPLLRSKMRLQSPPAKSNFLAVTPIDGDNGTARAYNSIGNASLQMTLGGSKNVLRAQIALEEE